MTEFSWDGFTITLLVVGILVAIGILISIIYGINERMAKNDKLHTLQTRLEKKGYDNKEIRKRLSYARRNYRLDSDGYLYAPLVAIVMSDDFDSQYHSSSHHDHTHHDNDLSSNHDSYSSDYSSSSYDSSSSSFDSSSGGDAGGF
ncbi:hypothetical protein ACR56S_03810 [Staphylococcus hominis]|uniref:hypothetical protein n=1 Tax=Staphylococcus hominis TaxID=1290 RepID=UPI003D9FF02E